MSRVRPVRNLEFQANIQTHVLRMFPAKKCATCAVQMTAVPGFWTPGRPFPRTMATKGHVAPSSHNGRRVWIPQCNGCNSDQAGMYLSEWVGQLRDAADPRAPTAAAALRKMTGDGIWCGCPPIRPATAIRALIAPAGEGK